MIAKGINTFKHDKILKDKKPTFAVLCLVEVIAILLFLK